MRKGIAYATSLIAVAIIASGSVSNSTAVQIEQKQQAKPTVKQETRVTKHYVLGTNRKHKLVEKYCDQYGVDTKLTKAIIHTESGWNQQARSGHGAIGMMQLMPQTARAMKENPYTEEGNIKGGVKYLAYLQKKFGKHNQRIVIAAYNAGEGNVMRYGGVPPFPQTRAYVKKVNENKAYY